MNDQLGLNRSHSILLAFNAILGFIYSTLPNTYLVKPAATTATIIMAAIAAMISVGVWYYGRAHQNKLKKQLGISTVENDLLDSSMKWLLPAFFIGMFAFIGTRALIVYGALNAPLQTTTATITAFNADEHWWAVQLDAPFHQTLTLAAPYNINEFTAGEQIIFGYHETKLAYTFTNTTNYWKISKKP